LYFTALAFPDTWNISGHGGQKPAFFTNYARTFGSNESGNISIPGHTLPDSNAMLAYDVMFVLLKGNDIVLVQSRDHFIDLEHALTTITGSQGIQGVSGQISFGPLGDPLDKAILVLSFGARGHVQIDSISGSFLKKNEP
jgi:hypothetical protein